ncbi:MAG: FG-GAP-like repeat-containing protein [Acidobacteriaceae bacterium]
MYRSLVSALLSLACLSTLPALAQAGSTQADVTLSVPANPTASGVSLTGTVQPLMPSIPTALPHPSGSLTFFDGGTALNTGGTALTTGVAYSSATFAQTFGTPDAAVSASRSGQVQGDFNGDGRPDLVLYSVAQPGTSSSALVLQAFISNGEVTPSSNGPISYVTLPEQTIPMPSLPAYPGYAGDVAVIDIDGNGHLDLLLGNTVAYGKGDGTFSNPTVLPVLATGFSQAYAVDINGDGKLDIVAVNTPPKPTSISVTTVQYMFTVFRNDGGGTFTSLGTFPLAASFQTGNLCCATYGINGLSFADLNGDGKLDVLSQSNVVPNTQSSAALHLNVMLNNGDGTFGAPKPVDNSALLDIGGDGVAFGNINGDGKQDLVVAYSSQNENVFLGAALGNGDGTFGAFSQLKLINFLTMGIYNPQVQLIDFNADGKLDAVVGSGELALGNGDGTFTLSTPLFSQPANPQIPVNYPLLQANLFPHSWPSLIYLNVPTGANAVFTPLDSSNASTSVALSAGMHTLTAHYSGDSTYAAAVSPEVTVTVAAAATTMTLTSSANPSYAGQSVTFTATIAGLAPGAGGTVTFSNGSTTLGTATVSNGSASYATTLSSAGNQTITAGYSGDANDAASSGTVNQAVEAPVTIAAASGGSTTLTVASGHSVTTQVSVAGAGGFSGTVNLSCTGLPANASCSFSPASMTVSGTTAANTTLTVSTAATATASVVGDGSLRAMTALACGLPLLGLLALLPVGRGRRLLLCAGFALLVAAGGLTGCGGGGQSSATKTAPGNYTFKVVATSSSTTSTASYTLTVQ